MHRNMNPVFCLGALVTALALPGSPARGGDDTGPVYDVEARVITVRHKAPPIHDMSMDALMKAPGVDVLSSPRLRVRASQEAEIHIGDELQYMERRDDGEEHNPGDTFVLKTLKGGDSAGIHLAVEVKPEGEDRVMLSVDLAISVMAERMPIPGVDLDVGLPMLTSTSVHTQSVTPLGEWVKLAGRQVTDASTGEPERLAVMVRVTLVPPDHSG